MLLVNTYFVSKRFLQSDQVGANDSLAETSIAESAELVNRFRFSYKINKNIAQISKLTMRQAQENVFLQIRRKI